MKANAPLKNLMQLQLEIPMLKQKELDNIELLKADILELTTMQSECRDENEVGSLNQERDMKISLLKKAKSGLSRFSLINLAFSEDRFGYCIECGHSIDLQRMNNDPTTISCFECKSKTEARNKHFNH